MRFAILALCAGACFAQTAVDLAHQAKTPDFSVMQHTRPAQTGTVLPASCNAGEVFFKTDAAPGSNLYLATSGYPCTWTQVNPLTVGGTAGQIQFNNSGSFSGFSVNGDGTLTPSTGALTVTKTNGVAFAPSATTDTTKASNLTSGTLPAGRMPALSGDVSSTVGNTSVTVGRINGTSVPLNGAADTLLGTTAASTGIWFAVPNCQDASGNHLNYNTTTHTFTCGSTGTGPGGTANQIQFNNSGSLGGFSVSGDGTLTPSTGALTVTKTNGVAFAASATTDTTNASNLTSGTLPAGRMPAFSGDVLSTVGNTTLTVGRISGTSVPVNGAADTLLGTTAASTGGWLAVPNCQDAAGNHLNYNTTTHTFTCGSTGTGGSGPAGAVGDLQVNAGPGQFGVATGQKLMSLLWPNRTYTVGPDKFRSIRDAYNQCVADIGSGYGTCHIDDANLNETMNALPWKDDHTEKINVRLHLGNGILKICDAGTGTDGLTCAAPFSLSTGNGGEISGLGSVPGQNLGLNTVIQAGSLEHDVPLVILGDNTLYTQDSFGAQVHDLNVDCNNQVGMTGIKNMSAQENSMLRNYNIRNCNGVSLHIASVKANNSMALNGNIVMGTNFSSASIPVLLANATEPRPISGLTVQGNSNGPSIATATASYAASGNVGSITGISYDKTVFGPTNGPNGTPSYILVSSVTGWNGVWPVLSNTGCVSNTCTGMTVQLTSNPASQSNVGTINLVPTYGIVACAGTACNSFGGDTSTAIGASVINLFGIHVERMGVALEVTGNSALSVAATQFTCTSNDYICVETQNSASIRDVQFHQLAGGGAPTLINDLIAATAITDPFKGNYTTGTPAPTTGGLVQWSVPLVLTERAAPATGTAGSGRAVLYADSTSHRLTMNNANGGASRLFGELDFPSCLDSGGNHLNYDPVAKTFSCGTSGGTGGGSMTYPGAGIPVSTGTAWGTSITAGTAGHVLRSNGATFVDSAIQASDVPVLNQNTTGTAANLSGTPALPNGTTAATQTAGDNTTKLATTAYVDAGLATKSGYPASGLAVSGGTAWGSSLVAGAAGHVVRSNGTAFADSAIQASDIPTLNQNTTGTAANLSGTPALPNGTTGTTQNGGDNSTKLATTAYVDSGLSGKAASNASVTINGVSCVLGSSCAPTGPAGASGGYEVLKFIFGAGVGASVAVNDTAQTNPPYRSTSLAGCFAHAETAPVGQALIVDVLVGGASVFGANPKITINAGTNDASMVTTFATAAISPTSAPKAVVTQTGTTTAGAGVTVVCGTTDSGVVVDTDSTGAANSDLKVMSQKASNTALALKEDKANKGAANGYASLDATGKVPSSQIPATVGGSGPVLLTDTGADGTHFAASPSGCAAGDLVDGKTFLFRPAHTSTGGGSTFTYCGTSKTLVLTGGSNPSVNDIFQSTTANPRMYEIVYHASPIDKFEIMDHLRMSSDTEAGIGTDPTLAVNMPQVKNAINTYSPLGPNLGMRFQVARTSGTTWGPVDPAVFPGSGRTYHEFFANGSSTLEARRMALVTTGNCASQTAAGISSSAPALVSFPTNATSVGQYCIVGTGTVTWAGTEEVFDATLKLSQASNVSYFFGLVDAGQVNSSILNYTSGNYPGAVVGFRFDPAATTPDTVTYRCTAARNSTTAPMVADAGASYGTVGTGVTQFQFRLDEASGTARWFIGSGGVLNEVCTSGSWGGNLPSGTGLALYVGEYVTGSVGSAPTLGIAYVSLDNDTVPGVRP
jgi:hypothetical protein